MAHTGAYHDRLEGLSPNISILPGYYCTARMPPNVNSREALSRAGAPPTAALISRATCSTRSACTTAQALSAFPVTWAVLPPSSKNWQGEDWWLTDQDFSRSRVSCPVRVGWFLTVIPGQKGVMCHNKVPHLEVRGGGEISKITKKSNNEEKQGWRTHHMTPTNTSKWK